MATVERELELALLWIFLALWTVALGAMIGFLPATGLVDLGLYQFYGLASLLGWLAGNVYVHRTKGVSKPLRRRLILIYLLGPPALIYLIRSMAPMSTQAQAPFAAIYACGVFAIFFLVPVTLKSSLRR